MRNRAMAEDKDVADHVHEDAGEVDEVPGTDQEDHHNSRRQPERRQAHNRPQTTPPNVRTVVSPTREILCMF